MQLSLSQSTTRDSLHECVFEYVIVYSQKREKKRLDVCCFHYKQIQMSNKKNCTSVGKGVY